MSAEKTVISPSVSLISAVILISNGDLEAAMPLANYLMRRHWADFDRVADWLERIPHVR